MRSGPSVARAASLDRSARQRSGRLGLGRSMCCHSALGRAEALIGSRREEWLLAVSTRPLDWCGAAARAALSLACDLRPALMLEVEVVAGRATPVQERGEVADPARLHILRDLP